MRWAGLLLLASSSALLGESLTVMILFEPKAG